MSTAPNSFEVKLPEGRSTINRYRLYVNNSDYRPMFYPPPHPWWCSGQTMNEAIIISYAGDETEVKALWPELNSPQYKIDSCDKKDRYSFSSRFQPPDWWMNTNFSEGGVECKKEWTYQESYEKLLQAGWVLS